MLARLRCYRFALRLAMFAVPMAAYLLAGVLRFGMEFFASSQYGRGAYLSGLFVYAATWMLVAEGSGLAALQPRSTPRGTAGRFIYPTLLAAGAALAALFFMHAAGISRLFFATAIALTVLMAVATESVFRVLARRVGREKPVRLLIIGADGFARRVAARLKGNSLPPCEVVGFVRLPGQRLRVATTEVIAAERLRRMEVACDDVVIAATPDHWPGVAATVPRLRALGHPIRIVLSVGSAWAVERPFPVAGMQLLSIGGVEAESVRYVLLKRCFDVAFSAAALFITAPLLGLIALAVKLSSPGPALFRQERVGLHGERFKMLKFRSMRVAGAAEGETQWTTAQDPRRTTVGRFLRRTSLDELPQFWNVLKGDMSVVGPRPERPYFVRKFAGEVGGYGRRHLLKAGITGWAQVNGWRGDTSIRRRVEHDLYYLRNWSFALDLRIIARTVWSGMAGRNAY